MKTLKLIIKSWYKANYSDPSLSIIGASGLMVTFAIVIINLI